MYIIYFIFKRKIFQSGNLQSRLEDVRLDVITKFRKRIIRNYWSTYTLIKNMALALPELLKNILNFLAKDNALYPTLLVSRLWSRCTGPILWGRIELIGEKQQEKFIKMICINSRLIFRHSVQCLIITHHSYLSNEIIEK